MTTPTLDDRRELESLAYRARSFPDMSVEGDLAEIAPDLTVIARDSYFGELIDGITVRDAACKACAAGRSEIVEILDEPRIGRTATRAAGVLYRMVLATARVCAAIERRDWAVLEDLDRGVAGARDELRNLKAGFFTSDDYPDADPERLVELAEEKVEAALGDFSVRQSALLESRLELFTVAVWRFADRARMRLTGGAR